MFRYTLATLTLATLTLNSQTHAADKEESNQLLFELPKGAKLYFGNNKEPKNNKDQSSWLAVNPLAKGKSGELSIKIVYMRNGKEVSYEERLWVSGNRTYVFYYADLAEPNQAERTKWRILQTQTIMVAHIIDQEGRKETAQVGGVIQALESMKLEGCQKELIDAHAECLKGLRAWEDLVKANQEMQAKLNSGKFEFPPGGFEKWKTEVLPLLKDGWRGPIGRHLKALKDLDATIKLKGASSVAGIELDKDAVEVESSEEVVTIDKGVVVKIERSRTISHDAQFERSKVGTIEVGASGDIYIAKIEAQVRGQIGTKLGKAIQQSETFRQEVTLDGNVCQKYKITWYDKIRKGTFTLGDGQTVPFTFRESSQLKVTAVPAK